MAGESLYDGPSKKTLIVTVPFYGTILPVTRHPRVWGISSRQGNESWNCENQEGHER